MSSTVDLYPDTLAGIPATTAKEWLQGRNVQPIMLSMQTGQNILSIHNNNNNTMKKQRNTSSTNNDNNKLHNDSNYNMQNKTNGSESDINTGNNKENDQKYDNNSMKFAFLAQQTIPDYRTQTVSMVCICCFFKFFFLNLLILMFFC